MPLQSAALEGVLVLTWSPALREVMRLLILENITPALPHSSVPRGSPPHVIASHIDTTEAQARPRARPRDILLKRPRSKHSCGSLARARGACPPTPGSKSCDGRLYRLFRQAPAAPSPPLLANSSTPYTSGERPARPRLESRRSRRVPMVSPWSSSVVERAQAGDTALDPVRLRHVGGQLEVHDKVG